MKIIRNIKPEFVDERGSITNILPKDVNIASALLITSKAGSIRSNHYHKKDPHYCYIVSGKAEWNEKLVGGDKLESEIVGAGDMVYTPPMMIHAVKFLEDTIFWAFAVQPRDQDAYEEDTIKHKLF